ncbi:MAG: glycosyltransferase family 2 protein [archaeon]
MLEGLSLCILAYNEERTIKRLILHCLEKGRAVARRCEVIVVLYEGSSDKTRQIVESLVKTHKAKKEIRLVVQPHGDRGYGEALRLAVTNARMPYIFYTDGDAQFDVDDIDRLLPHVERNELVTGYRLRRRDQPMRILAAWVYNLLLKIVFGTKVKDIDCAFKIYQKKMFSKITITCKTGMADAEVFIKAMHAGFRIKEVGVRHFARKEGTAVFQNKLGLIKPKVVLDLLRDMRSIHHQVHDKG